MNAAQRDPALSNMVPGRPVHAEYSAAWTILDLLRGQRAEA